MAKRVNINDKLIEAGELEITAEQVLNNALQNLNELKAVDRTVAVGAVAINKDGTIKIANGHPVVEGQEFVIDWSLQPRVETNGDDLIDDIRSRGLIEPIVLGDVEGIGLLLLKGHRRTDALSKMAGKEAEVFKQLFPEGVPAKVYENITVEQALEIRDDHDLDILKQGLTNRVEVFNLIRPKFEAKWPVSKILSTSWRTIARVMSTKYAELVAEIKDLKTDKEKYEKILNSQNGNYILLKAVYQAPNVLKDYWTNSELNPKGYPKIKQTEFKKLVALFKDEVREGLADAKNLQKYTKMAPGPMFLEAFEAAVKEAATPRESGIKPMTSKERDELMGTLNTKLATLTLKAVANPVEVMSVLEQVDKNFAPIEAAAEVDFDSMTAIAAAITLNGRLTKTDRNKVLQVIK